MRFRCEHTFRGVTLAEYEQLFFDEEFNIALCDAVKLKRELVTNERDDEKLYRVVRVGPDRDVPAPVAKILKADRIEYEERNRYRWGDMRGTWETIPNILANKVETKGSYSFNEVAGGVRRVVEGDIQVKILGVGGVVEKFIVSDVERSYDDAARFTQKWIDAGKHRADEGAS